MYITIIQMCFRHHDIQQSMVLCIVSQHLSFGSASDEHCGGNLATSLLVPLLDTAFSPPASLMLESKVTITL